MIRIRTAQSIALLPLALLTACASGDDLFNTLAAGALGYAVAGTTGDTVAATQLAMGLVSDTATADEKSQMANQALSSAFMSTPKTGLAGALLPVITSAAGTSSPANGSMGTGVKLAELSSTDTNYSNPLVREATAKLPHLSLPSAGNCPDTLEWIQPRIVAARNVPELSSMLSSGIGQSTRREYQTLISQGRSPATAIQQARQAIQSFESSMAQSIQGIRQTTPGGSLVAIQTYLAGERYNGPSTQEALIKALISNYTAAEIARGGMINFACYAQEGQG